jgi:hypothetical protein
MDDQVILHVGDRRFLLSMDEAMNLCNVLCGASRLNKEWISRDNSSAWLIGEPDLSAAYITPFTAHMQLQCDANRREKESK